jgi:hypothetical protein
LIHFHLHANLFEFVPHKPNDQVGYWRLIYTFSQVGFEGGYYGPDEKLSPLENMRFSTAGPMFPLLYGTIAHFTGWQPYTGILFNMVLLAFALWIFMNVCRLSKIQIAMLTLFIASFWPLILFIPTMMQESFHHAMAILLAAFFYRILQERGQISWYFLAAIALFLIIISFIRISWGLFLLPLFILSLKKNGLPQILLAAIISMILIVIIVYISSQLTTPTNHTIYDTLASFRVSIYEGLRATRNLLFNNFQGVVKAYLAAQTRVVQGIQICFLVGANLITVVRFMRGKPSSTSPALVFSTFHLFNLVSIVSLAMLLYLAEGFSRVFAPHLLVSLLLLIAFNRFWLVVVVISSNLLVIGSFLNEYQLNKQNFMVDRSELAEFQQIIEKYVIYDANTSNSWCNTLLIDAHSYDSRVIIFPAGIGISFLRRFNLDFPLKSQYFLLDEDILLRLGESVNVELLVQLPIGNLYRNMDANCESEVKPMMH